MITQLGEWVIVVIRLNFFWPFISPSSVTDTATVGVQDILFISFVPAWLERRTCFTWITK